MVKRASALRFFGVVDAVDAENDHGPPLSVDGVSLVQFRDLGAVVAPAEYVRAKPGDAELAEYVRVIDHLNEHGPIIPAPPGTVFKSADVLRHWLEVHYAKLHETLGVIERRGTKQAPYDFVRMDFGG